MLLDPVGPRDDPRARRLADVRARLDPPEDAGGRGVERLDRGAPRRAGRQGDDAIGPFTEGGAEGGRRTATGSGRAIARFFGNSSPNSICTRVEKTRAAIVPIAIRMRCGADRASFVVSDRGGVMPGGKLPEGTLPESGPPPEGGYGWFLVRAMAEHLDYRRSARTNLTRFEVVLEE